MAALHHTRRLTDEQEDEAARLYRDGKFIHEIAGHFDVGRKVISNALRRQGCAKRSKREATAHRNERRREAGLPHPNWKGGRTKSADGYALVAVTDADPMFSMAKDRGRLSSYGYGYVLEHRLVMARAIGRPLSSEETVHHRNGDRADNRIENLQLMTGRHGKGQAFRCAECGSHNIVAVARD